MRFLTIILLAVGAVEALSGESPNVEPMFAGRKRQLQSCVETYGSGSISCGGPASSFCFNPSLGQSCCATDNGFCEAGSYCAPVAGFCCIEGETPQECARAAGFVLPPSFTATVTSTLLLPGPRPTGTEAKSFAPVPSKSTGAAAPTGARTNSTGRPPFVTVNAASRMSQGVRIGTLVWVTMGVSAALC